MSFLKKLFGGGDAGSQGPKVAQRWARKATKASSSKRSRCAPDPRVSARRAPSRRTVRPTASCAPTGRQARTNWSAMAIAKGRQIVDEQGEGIFSELAGEADEVRALADEAEERISRLGLYRTADPGRAVERHGKVAEGEDAEDNQGLDQPKARGAQPAIVRLVCLDAHRRILFAATWAKMHRLTRSFWSIALAEARRRLGGTVTAGLVAERLVDRGLHDGAEELDRLHHLVVGQGADQSCRPKRSCRTIRAASGSCR